MTESERESITRGFLFADLRGYTDFVETHGDGRGRAAEPVSRAGPRGDRPLRWRRDQDRGRQLLRRLQLGQRGGAVRPRHGRRGRRRLERTSRGADPGRRRHPRRRDRGVDGGYVGSAVNIAARICAQAGPGEVLVSETVRALTRRVLPVNSSRAADDSSRASPSRSSCSPSCRPVRASMPGRSTGVGVAQVAGVGRSSRWESAP